MPGKNRSGYITVDGSTDSDIANGFGYGYNSDAVHTIDLPHGTYVALVVNLDYLDSELPPVYKIIRRGESHFKSTTTLRIVGDDGLSLKIAKLMLADLTENREDTEISALFDI